MLEIGRCETEADLLGCIETAAAEHRPVTVLIIDGRLLHNRDPKGILRRSWHIQRNLHVLLHDVSGTLNLDQLAIELGDPPQLLVLKNRLATFELAQVVRLLVAKSRSDKTISYRDLDQNTQLLDLARRFEDASNRLQNEQDIRMRLEEKLARTRRLETLGRLAEGVAHYFNNHLTVIQSHLSIAMSVRDGSPRLIASLEELFAASKEAAEVSAQLLQFDRWEPAPHTPVHLERCIRAREMLIRHLLGAQIEVDIWFESPLPEVMADPAGLGQILLAIAAHAREAMPAGGRLSVRGSVVRVPDEASARRLHPEARCGDFVVLAITDSSNGLDPSEIASLFDPSADRGHGRAAGLLHVPDLARQQHGWLAVKSVKDVGTEFLIHLPCVSSAGTGAAPGPDIPQPDADGPGATILVVDDEDSVRQVIDYVLTSQGHNVLLARNASEAWQLWRSRRHLVRLAIVDVQLPGGANGFDLEKAICDEDPTLPVVFTCGYAAASLQQSKKLVPGENFLPKPFGMPELLTVVGNALLKPARL